MSFITVTSTEESWKIPLKVRLNVACIASWKRRDPLSARPEVRTDLSVITLMGIEQSLIVTETVEEIDRLILQAASGLPPAPSV